MFRPTLTKPNYPSSLARAVSAAVTTLTLASAVAIPAQAQQEQLVLEVVKVVAQKREESVFEVPAAVSAVSAEMLANAGVTDFAGITAVSPSLTIKDAGVTANASINLRGIGTYAFSIGVEPSVSVIVDDVPVVQQAQAFNSLSDIERIEILRGPQGTLFGKNSSAGVVNIVTAGPTEELEGYIEGTLTDDDEWRVNASISGPMGNNAGFRINAYTHERDGYITNLTNGDKYNDDSGFGIRGKFVFDPSDDLSIQVVADYSEREIDGNVATYRTIPDGSKLFGAFPTPLFTAGISPGENNFNTRLDYKPRSDNEQFTGSLKISYAMGEYNLVSVTSYQDWSYTFEQDVDGTEFNIAGAFTGGALEGGIYQLAPFEADQVTQELRLESPTGDDFDYIVGLWYSNAETDRIFDRVPLFIADWDAGTGNTNMAVFGQMNWHLSDKLDLSVGGRFGREEIEVYFDDNGAGTSYTGDDSETFSVGKVAAQYFIRDNLTSFVSVSSGYKGQGYDVSSGFNLNRAQNPVGSESSVSYEAGLKGAILEGRAQFSVVGFITDYEDFQAQSAEITATGLVFQLNNVGELRTQGIEAEFAAQLSTSWRLDAGLALIDANIEDFQGANCYPGQAPNEGCIDGTQDLSGKSLANSPDLKYNLGLTYETDLAGMPFSLFANGNYTYQDDVNFDLFANPRTIQDGYGIANFSVGIVDNDDRYRITAFVNNAFDEQYASVISDSSGFYGGNPVLTQILPRNAQRYAGVRARFSF